MSEKVYIAIDLKSFFASVECVERGLDPLKTNLLVADESRTEKTICLAVSPSLKKYGIPGRARLFEVVQKIKNVNAYRLESIANKTFSGESIYDCELEKDKTLKVSYLVAPPRMAYYMYYSTTIYKIYLKYIAPEDIHIYSIDEVFIDATHYLKTYNMSGKELASKLVDEIYRTTKITATAGVGTNLYLCKIAMDIVAKHIEPNEFGFRVAELDEMEYRRQLWNHTPITDFWRVGKGYKQKLESVGLYTMGDIARCSIGKSSEFYNENLLYKLFGINAELLIDHAWGYEPCEMSDIKNYKPSVKSVNTGQVLKEPYTADKARIVIREMAEEMSLDLFEKGMLTNKIDIIVGYDIENLSNPDIFHKYKGEIVTDVYGRKIPKSSHATKKLKEYTTSTKIITEHTIELYDSIINNKLLVRRLNIQADNLEKEENIRNLCKYEQLSLFTNYSEVQMNNEINEIDKQKEKNMQQAILDIKKKYGKNALVKGTSLCEGATAIERHSYIGGHKA